MKISANLKRMAAECGVTDILESMIQFNIGELEILRFVTGEFRDHVEREREENIHAVVSKQYESVGEKIFKDSEFMDTLAGIEDEEQAEELLFSRVKLERAVILKDLELPLQLIRQGFTRGVFIP